MRNLTYISAIAAAFLLLSCTKSTSPDRSNEFALSAVVGELGVEVKSSAVPFEGISSTTPLKAKLLCSFDKGKYTHAPLSPWYVPCFTDVSFESEDVTFIKYDSNSLTYPTPGDKVGDQTGNIYCIGLYDGKEESEWRIQETFAMHTIDGSADLMFADQIASSWNSTSTPIQQYTHLQTWIKILASASTNDAAAQWGKITKVTIKSSIAVTISFPSGVTETSEISYSPLEQDIAVYQDDLVGKDLSITTTEIGSVFISPSTSLSVTVHTKEFPDGMTVNNIKLYDLQHNEITDISKIRGYLFVLNLNFTPLSIIEGICTLNYWNDQDEDIYLE